jgi:dUTP pyrophosphatase
MDIDKDTLKKIEEQFKGIVDESGVTLDEDYMKELEDLLGFDINQLSEEMIKESRMVKLYIEKINDDAVLPKYSYPSDSGFDLCSTEQIIIPPFGRALVPTGIKVSFGENMEIQVRPKSGLAINMGLTVLNTPGTVDQGYTGEIKVIVFNTNNNSVVIEKGMKIAQGVLCPVLNGKYVDVIEVDSIEDKDRGDNGFGSTGI